MIEHDESLLEGEREQQARQQLDAGFHDPQFLQEARPVSVKPFGHILMASPHVPQLVAFRVVDVHPSVVPRLGRTKPG
ncbi:hypothetical protein NJBCHELONAE_33360 [Mycobacteroides chelonae]|nr:hypothetical protein NJBCHELONAE_33360 [Mycobacteroides chelonae]